MRRLAVLTLCLLTMVGCSDDGPKCVVGHYDYIPMWRTQCITSGKTTTCTPVFTTVPVWRCDQYETPSVSPSREPM